MKEATYKRLLEEGCEPPTAEELTYGQKTVASVAFTLKDGPTLEGFDEGKMFMLGISYGVLLSADVEKNGFGKRWIIFKLAELIVKSFREVHGPDAVMPV